VLNGLAEDGTAARSLELLIEKIKVTKSNTEFLQEIAKARGAL
jgi:transcription termination factor Rho